MHEFGWRRRNANLFIVILDHIRNRISCYPTVIDVSGVVGGAGGKGADIACWLMVGETEDGGK